MTIKERLSRLFRMNKTRTRNDFWNNRLCKNIICLFKYEEQLIVSNECIIPSSEGILKRSVYEQSARRIRLGHSKLYVYFKILQNISII